MTADERREKNKLYQKEWYQRNKAKKDAAAKAWRELNLERSREIGRESMRRAAAAKAVAEGREPGRIGRPPILTPDEKRAKRKAKTERWTALHLDEVREKARIREAQKRAGIFISKALPRLTEEQRKARECQNFHKRRALLAQSGGAYTQADVDRIRVAQRGLCLFCGKPLGADLPHTDHWTPISKGGSNGPENIALLHQFCNLRKAAHLPSKFGFPDDPALVRAALTCPLTTAVSEGDN